MTMLRKQNAARTHRKVSLTLHMASLCKTNQTLSQNVYLTRLLCVKLTLALCILARLLPQKSGNIRRASLLLCYQRLNKLDVCHFDRHHEGGE